MSASPLASSTTPPGARSAATQFDHYIPRFILRNFEQDDPSPLPNNDSTDGNQNNKNPVKPRQAVRTYLLREGTITYAPVSKLYGINGLYSSLQADKEGLEHKLGILENDVSATLRRIWNATDSITLKQKDIRELRKFSFISQYRTPSRQRQYIYGDVNIALGLPDPIMLAVREHGRSLTPPASSCVDVWWRNMKEIINTPGLQIEQNEAVFRGVRTEYDLFRGCYFMCIWRAPSAKEFIMTDRATLNEGLIPLVMDGPNGPQIEAHIFWHRFVVISPTTALAFSHNSFREMEQREKWLSGEGPLGPMRPSVLEDLSREIHPIPTGKITPLKIEQWPLLTKLINLMERSFWSTRENPLTFRVVEVPPKVVDVVNSMQLHHCESSVSFMSGLNKTDTLEAYEKNRYFDNPQRDWSAFKRALRS